VYSTGVDELDVLLGGGIDRGTAMLLAGTTGTGKSSVTMQRLMAAVQRGHAAAVYLFDEQLHLWLHRADNLGLPLRRHVAAGHIHVKQIDPAEMSPGQFAHEVQQTVQQNAVRLVVIDSLTGYLTAMPDQRFLSLHMHELLAWLSHQGTTTLLVLSQHGMLDSTVTPPIDLSYLTDTILLFRYFEYQGMIRRALSVVKRRGGLHERTIREMTMGPNGVSVGKPLTEFHGVLTGVPTYTGGDTRGQP
jgi:circadian clock protein KaiC